MQVPVIIDSDRNFLDAILTDRLAMEHSPFLAGDMATALYDLERSASSVNGVFVNSKMGKRGIRSLAEVVSKTDLPLFLLYDESLTVFFSPEDLASLNIKATINKPVTYESLVSRLTMEKKAQSQSSQAGDVAALAKLARTEGYALLPRENFKAGTIVENSIYVRTAANEYQEVLKGGEAITPDLVQENLFIKLEEHQYVVVTTLSKGEETVQFLKSSGVSPEALKEANVFVGNVSKMVAQLHEGDGQGLGQLLARLSTHEHALSTTVIASLFLRPLVIHSEQGHKIVGLASLCHDIGLSDDAELLALKPVSEMSEFDRKQYYQHPLTSSGLLGFLEGMDPEVVRAVEQHHERRDGSGFPNALKGDAISPFAEIIGLADRLSENIEKFKKGLLKENPFENLEKTINNEFSATTIQAYRKVLRRSS